MGVKNSFAKFFDIDEKCVHVGAFNITVDLGDNANLELERRIKDAHLSCTFESVPVKRNSSCGANTDSATFVENTKKLKVRRSDVIKLFHGVDNYIFRYWGGGNEFKTQLIHALFEEAFIGNLGYQDPLQHMDLPQRAFHDLRSTRAKRFYNSMFSLHRGVLPINWNGISWLSKDMEYNPNFIGTNISDLPISSDERGYFKFKINTSSVLYGILYPYVVKDFDAKEPKVRLRGGDRLVTVNMHCSKLHRCFDALDVVQQSKSLYKNQLIHRHNNNIRFAGHSSTQSCDAEGVQVGNIGEDGQDEMLLLSDISTSGEVVIDNLVVASEQKPVVSAIPPVVSAVSDDDILDAVLLPPATEISTCYVNARNAIRSLQDVKSILRSRDFFYFFSRGKGVLCTQRYILWLMLNIDAEIAFIEYQQDAIALDSLNNIFSGIHDEIQHIADIYDWMVFSKVTYRKQYINFSRGQVQEMVSELKSFAASNTGASDLELLERLKELRGCEVLDFDWCINIIESSTTEGDHNDLFNGINQLRQVLLSTDDEIDQFVECLSLLAVCSSNPAALTHPKIRISKLQGFKRSLYRGLYHIPILSSLFLKYSNPSSSVVTNAAKSSKKSMMIPRSAFVERLYSNLGFIREDERYFDSESGFKWVTQDRRRKRHMTGTGEDIVITLSKHRKVWIICAVLGASILLVVSVLARIGVVMEVLPLPLERAFYFIRGVCDSVFIMLGIDTIVDVVILQVVNAIAIMVRIIDKFLLGNILCNIIRVLLKIVTELCLAVIRSMHVVVEHLIDYGVNSVLIGLDNARRSFHELDSETMYKWVSSIAKTLFDMTTIGEDTKTYGESKMVVLRNVPVVSLFANAYLFVKEQQDEYRKRKASKSEEEKLIASGVVLPTGIKFLANKSSNGEKGLLSKIARKVHGSEIMSGPVRENLQSSVMSSNMYKENQDFYKGLMGALVALDKRIRLPLNTNASEDAKRQVKIQIVAKMNAIETWMEQIHKEGLFVIMRQFERWENNTCHRSITASLFMYYRILCYLNENLKKSAEECIYDERVLHVVDCLFRAPIADALCIMRQIDKNYLSHSPSNYIRGFVDAFHLPVMSLFPSSDAREVAHNIAIVNGNISFFDRLFEWFIHSVREFSSHKQIIVSVLGFHVVSDILGAKRIVTALHEFPEIIEGLVSKLGFEPIIDNLLETEIADFVMNIVYANYESLKDAALFAMTVLHGVAGYSDNIEEFKHLVNPMFKITCELFGINAVEHAIAKSKGDFLMGRHLKKLEKEKTSEVIADELYGGQREREGVEGENLLLKSVASFEAPSMVSFVSIEPSKALESVSVDSFSVGLAA